MKIVLMGAPGCGKGTQSPYIQDRYGLCHLSTGDMLRDAVARKTANGKLAKDAMDSGKLVSDDIVFGIVKDSIKNPECRYGYILDGYPRTLKQAQMMEDAGEKIDKVIEFSVPDEVILERTSGRWIHKPSGRTYHEVFRPPKTPGKDDITGEDLYQRPDDRREVCEKRLDIYKNETRPLADYFIKEGVYSMINANQTIDEVRKAIAALLDPIGIATGLK
ncbi:adenylate kinase [Leishmania donovani]|uniref:Adenylate_kinase_-_putative n=3 Tax=Leishmania donovani species complex TaxID=38574 RepID=A0A6L0XZ75_LEIIN|nr:putative adenylate kinase [Leishmania infantum JPCM5]XP_003864177.1 adenylate kinase, putative [Leishmania donovani]CAC9535714.1 adenylate_kinase_-_putative [Leishmania infantum]TPP39926.1 adenylate kinase family protein [Leishmania donovani]TPP50525.1 adenylate kinase family protein [Leishmania donovani]CAJ1992344.1 adenylate kinase [Leishmania donovani]CAM71483.1 putative adenylate kinase [Leishmania infantum JPCM5]|eukprot:XP_001468399.1 putative adenylate kinase [Leishmania infantum JPCM5]